MNALNLDSRAGLPDALRVLVEQMPREGWEGHDNFGELIRFWLERHVLFRRLNGMMTDQIQDLMDGRSASPGRFGQLGQMFVGQLHQHHHIEDHHYFPRIVGLEPKIARAFEILDRDHHFLDAHLAEFTGAANKLLQAPPSVLIDPAADVHRLLLDQQRFLNRHLTDEEETIVPVLLTHPLTDF